MENLGHRIVDTLHHEVNEREKSFYPVAGVTPNHLPSWPESLRALDFEQANSGGPSLQTDRADACGRTALARFTSVAWALHPSKDFLNFSMARRVGRSRHPVMPLPCSSGNHLLFFRRAWHSGVLTCHEGTDGSIQPGIDQRL